MQPNQSYINSLSKGDETFKQKLIDVIKKEFPEEKQVYFDYYNAKDYKLAADKVHKLKHKISILGLVKSYDVASAYEKDLREGNTNLEKQFEAVLDIISNYLKAL